MNWSRASSIAPALPRPASSARRYFVFSKPAASFMTFVAEPSPASSTAPGSIPRLVCQKVLTQLHEMRCSAVCSHHAACAWLCFIEQWCAPNSILVNQDHLAKVERRPDCAGEQGDAVHAGRGAHPGALHV